MKIPITLATLLFFGCTTPQDELSSRAKQMPSDWTETLAAHRIIPLYPPRGIEVGDIFVSAPVVADSRIPVLPGRYDNALRLKPELALASVGASATDLQIVEAQAEFPSISLSATSIGQASAGAMASKWLLDGSAAHSAEAVASAVFTFEDVTYLSIGSNIVLSMLFEERGGVAAGSGRSTVSGQPVAGGMDGSALEAVLNRQRRLRSELRANLYLSHPLDAVLLRVATEVYQARKIVATIHLDRTSTQELRSELLAAIRKADLKHSSIGNYTIAVERTFVAPLAFGFRGVEVFVDPETGVITEATGQHAVEATFKKPSDDHRL